MITAVAGTLEAKGADWVQVRIGGGISLHVSVPASTIEDLGSPGDEVRLHTRLYVRDDQPVLYGFASPEALRLFQLLNGVSGIGPRTSLALLSSLGPQSLITAVASGDVEALSRVPGVGRKSAGRLVLDLKGKLQIEELTQAPGTDESGNVVSALMALGYSANEARRAAEGTGSADGVPLEERVRRALQRLAG